MTTAYVLTVASDPVCGDGPSGPLVARALLGERMLVASRQIVQEDEE
jgi:hypothetical protein